MTVVSKTLSRVLAARRTRKGENMSVTNRSGCYMKTELSLTPGGNQVPGLRHVYGYDIPLGSGSVGSYSAGGEETHSN